LADELGSGVRNLFKYGRRYSGQDPQLIDGDVFRIIVPLDDSYSFDAGSNKTQSKTPIKTSKSENEVLIEVLILSHLQENPKMTQKEMCDVTGKSKMAVQSAFTALQQKGLLRREGAKMNGIWVVESSKVVNTKS